MKRDGCRPGLAASVLIVARAAACVPVLVADASIVATAAATPTPQQLNAHEAFRDQARVGGMTP